MGVLIDCHIHTARCGHATGTVAQMVGSAVFKGLAGIVLTEHLPLPDELDPERHLSPSACDLPAYAAEVHEMAERVHGLDVVLGGEADWLPGREDYAASIRAEAEALGVSVLLGSVHFLDDWAFDDPNSIELWESKSVDDVWRDYFSRWCDAARSGAFDIMAHPDLVKKFGHWPSFDARELYAAAAAAAAESGVAVEVSTAGLRKPVGELYPGPELLSAFRDAGVPVTAGSDAHAPGEVGFRIEAAYEAMVHAGYDRVAFPKGAGEWTYLDL